MLLVQIDQTLQVLICGSTPSQATRMHGFFGISGSGDDVTFGGSLTLIRVVSMWPGFDDEL